MNGYTKKEILGKERGLKFASLAIENISLELEKLKKIGASELAVLPIMIYWGLANNCFLKREDPDFTFEQVSDWVDDNIDNVSLFEEIAAAFESAKLVKKGMQIVEDEKKRTLISKQKKAGVK
jgi:hypothetical protein